jgi:mannose-6-phosphate isomerase-like protein (cupin superfamily)
MIAKVNIEERFATFTETWSPKIVAELNGQQVKLARLEGEFIWHHHADEDELFLVIDGTLRIELRDGAVELGPGEMVVVPRGVEHRPVAEGPVRILLFEPADTLNTGNITSERTVALPDRI